MNRPIRKETLSKEARSPAHSHFGARIRHAREEVGLSIRALAERAHVGPTTVFRLEKGDFKVQMDIVLRILEVLSISPATIFGASEETSSRIGPEELKLLRVIREGDPAAVIEKVGKYLSKRQQERRTE